MNSDYTQHVRSLRVKNGRLARWVAKGRARQRANHGGSHYLFALVALREENATDGGRLVGHGSLGVVRSSVLFVVRFVVRFVPAVTSTTLEVYEMIHCCQHLLVLPAMRS